MCIAGFKGDGTSCSGKIMLMLPSVSIFSVIAFYVFYVDLNECEEINDCHENSSCINTLGSFQCICLDGFVGDGRNDCSSK